MKRVRGFCVGFVLLTGSLAVAAEPIIEPTDTTDRVVLLNNGAVYHGEVVELEPRSHVIIRLPSGSVRRFEWRDLRRIGGTPAPSTPAASRVRQSGPDKLPSQQPSRPPLPHDRPSAAEARDASPTGEKYREHLSDAKVLEGIGQLSEALAAYRAAYAQRQEPFILYRMASLHDQLDHPRDALKLYRRYLNENPNLPEERQAEVATNIARLTLSLADSTPADSPRSHHDEPQTQTQTQRVSVGTMAAGISIWGTSYLISAIVGGLGLAGTQTSQFLNTNSSGGVAKAQAIFGTLLIPVAGPIVSSALAPVAEWAIPWVLIGAGSQIAGMSMTIAGARSRQVSPSSSRAWVLPFVSPASTGLALVGSF